MADWNMVSRKRESDPRPSSYQELALPLSHFGSVLSERFELPQTKCRLIYSQVRLTAPPTQLSKWNKTLRLPIILEPSVGFGPTTCCLQNSCSTTELRRRLLENTKKRRIILSKTKLKVQY